ncbi:MAG TPA: non-canonical purine NTP pyrophosphatase [Candidatus Paceibacterota bacterium]|nr:non-canonical purine NTP pyrophosphatase [Candidatus Paceibacterota bacterium]
MDVYDPKQIEAKWQKKWIDEKVFAANDNSSKPKYYQLETFPYPSAAGLHMGHPKGYTAEDIHARYTRMGGRAGQPKEVLYTMGWDAFGLPTENYAIKVGRNPKEITKENTDNFRRQVRMLGFSYDWDREVNTSSPDYYKWTQWLFIQLYKKGLAYRAKSNVNWCPKDQTVLANEQVVDGKCERCGSVIEERQMTQWFVKITDYAERLLEDLKGLDWPSSTIKRQEDWIGKSEGAEIDFPLTWPTPKMDLVFATNNKGKVGRMQKLFKAAGLPIMLKTPEDVGVKDFEVVEDGKTLAENAEKKARSLAEKTPLPVFADDTGFFIVGEEIDPVTVKRNALGGVDEKKLSVEEIATRMQSYYKDIASRHGGAVDAEWRHAFCFVTPEKIAVSSDAVRPVTLTAESKGAFDPTLPLRGMYIPKPTGKYPVDETEEEEMKELQPLIDGIKRLFTPSIKVFTTRPDTLFGATYLVLAPEHPFVQASIMRKALANTGDVKKYCEAASHKTELMRKAEEKEKTGVELQGVRAINPATKEEIPIWVADYVLGSYGTGAIMAVPAHDDRDFAFAKKFELPIRQVVMPHVIDPENPPRERKQNTTRDIIHALVKHPKENKFIALRSKKFPWLIPVTGGIEAGETPEQAALREIHEETGFKNVRFVKEFPFVIFAEFYAGHKDVNRAVTSHLLLFELENLDQDPLAQEEQELHDIEWLDAENVERYAPMSEKIFVPRWLREGDFAYAGEGTLINSGDFTGMDSEDAKWKIAELVGGRKKTQYKLRDWSISRQRYWAAPIPMIHCEKCGIVPVPEDQLPVLLPDLENYRPQGVAPLAGSKEFMPVKCPECGGAAERDPETMDTFVDSSWYFFRYTDPHNDAKIFDPKKAKHWLPVDLYIIGAEHTVLHLLYARFITKFFHDLGLTALTEPFTKLRHQGLILAHDGQKMSKSKGNVVNPDEIVAEFGADTTRMYLMFMGAFEDATPWSPKSMLGVERFLKRMWSYLVGADEGKLEKKTLEKINDPNKKILSLVHKTIKKVGEDIENFKFNTAISALMILLNELETAAPLEKSEREMIVKILHPFAPHMAQEIWSRMGHEAYLDFEAWPRYDEKLLAEEKVKIIVQVNGRVRDAIEADATVTEDEAKALAFASEKVKKAIGGATPTKIIYVEKKLVSIVV